MVAAAAALLALVLVECGLRLLPPAEPLGRLHYTDGERRPVAGLAEAAARRLVVPVPWPTPRPRMMFAPGQTFHLCYTDNQRLRRDWLDAEGCVEVRINSFGLREREELGPDKPAGQWRIVCLGDSFTFGWGIPIEACWTRLLEDELRQTGRDVRTVNCGAAGTVCVDEYWWGLRHRFHEFQPDLVLLTICLNDLVPSSGLNLIDPPRLTGIRLIDLVTGVFGRGPLDLDPSRDWVAELLALPHEAGLAGGMYHPDKPFEAMWSQGVPQESMRQAKTFCEARGCSLLVTLWPFLQGLGPGRHYPFRRLHELVAADLAAAGIPFLDLLPELEHTPAEQLWVTPADPHANPLAQRLVTPALARFVRAHAGL